MHRRGASLAAHRYFASVNTGTVVYPISPAFGSQTAAAEIGWRFKDGHALPCRASVDRIVARAGVTVQSPAPWKVPLAAAQATGFAVPCEGPADSVIGFLRRASPSAPDVVATTELRGFFSSM